MPIFITINTFLLQYSTTEYCTIWWCYVIFLELCFTGSRIRRLGQKYREGSSWCVAWIVELYLMHIQYLDLDLSFMLFSMLGFLQSVLCPPGDRCKISHEETHHCNWGSFAHVTQQPPSPPPSPPPPPPPSPELIQFYKFTILLPWQGTFLCKHR